MQLAQYSNNQSAASKGRGLLDMGNFLDTTNIDGRFDFSEWVRGYGKYLDEQLDVYKELSFYPVRPNLFIPLSALQSIRLESLDGPRHTPESRADNACDDPKFLAPAALLQLLEDYALRNYPLT